MVSAWVKAKKNVAISMLGSDLPRAAQKSAHGIDARSVTDELAILILRRYDGKHPQHELVSLHSSLIDRPEELAWGRVPCWCYSCRGGPANTWSKAKTPRLSEDLVIVYTGESRLAMALEGGDGTRPASRDLPKLLSGPRRGQTCQEAPEDKGRSRDDLICRSPIVRQPQNGTGAMAGAVAVAGTAGGADRSREVKRSTKAVTGYRLDLQGI